MDNKYSVPNRFGGGLRDGDEMPPGNADFARYDSGVVVLQSIGIAIMCVIMCVVCALYFSMITNVFNPAVSGVEAAHALATAIAR